MTDINNVGRNYGVVNGRDGYRACGPGAGGAGGAGTATAGGAAAAPVAGAAGVATVLVACTLPDEASGEGFKE